MNAEKKLFQYLFLILFAAMTAYTFLLRATFYNEEGFPHVKGSVLRIMGENLAGDYALFRLLENKTPPEEAYQSKNISDFLYKTAHVDGHFSSFASPMKSFVFVPWLSVAYDVFCETWIFWGIFLFGVALYSMFALPKALLLMFALPAAFLSFATGGWGVYAAAGTMLALVLADDYPKLSGFLAALCLVEPLVFLLIALALILRQQRKAAFYSLGFGTLLIVCSVMRYGADAFKSAWLSAVKILADRPCSFSSLYGILSCEGASPFFAIAIQSLIGIVVLCGAVKLLLKPSCPQAVQDAYLCAAGCLISPFFCLADFGLLYAGVAFLLKDSEQRGYLKGDGLFFIAAFCSVYVETLLSEYTAAPFQFFLAVWLLFVSYRRRY